MGLHFNSEPAFIDLVVLAARLFNLYNRSLSSRNRNETSCNSITNIHIWLCYWVYTLPLSSASFTAFYNCMQYWEIVVCRPVRPWEKRAPSHRNVKTVFFHRLTCIKKKSCLLQDESLPRYILTIDIRYCDKCILRYKILQSMT